MRRDFVRNKYDYRDLWMKFSEKASGSLNLTELLPRVGEFIIESMFVQQAAIWLSADTSRKLVLAYHHEPTGSTLAALSIRLRKDWKVTAPIEAYNVGGESRGTPFEDHQAFHKLGVQRCVIVRRDETLLGVLGVGPNVGNMAPTGEESQLLASMSKQLAHLIMNQRLSEELLLAREWDSFNRFSSFILHDLKNLATLQSMTLENAKTRKDDPKFLADVFSTFGQTTDKMINLIASLSVRTGELSLKQQPLNLLTVIRNALDDIDTETRVGLEVITHFPAQTHAPIVIGDPELLQKAFTNILLNAIQSLPKGEGSVEIKVTNSEDGKITAEITDTGCGMSPEQLQKLFRPFQTTKRHGMGVGLCHTRSIVEFHGGNIHIESEMNTGTRVEIKIPTVVKSEKERNFSEAQNPRG